MITQLAADTLMRESPVSHIKSACMAQREVHVSVVSHGQAALVNDLLGDIKQWCDSVAVQVTLTINIEEHFGTVEETKKCPYTHQGVYAEKLYPRPFTIPNCKVGVPYRLIVLKPEI